jgi:hypothetical protein
MRRFAIVALLLASCAAPPEPLPMLPAPPAATLRLSAKDRQLRVEGDGLASVEFAGATATVRLAGGATLIVAYDAKTATFTVEALEDAESAIDVGIGHAVVHVTKGDVFQARVLGDHLDVVVKRGLVVVAGPDKRSAEVAQGGQMTVSGGGRGAVEGAAAEPAAPPPPRTVPREPRRATILDRTDVAPGP